MTDSLGVPGGDEKKLSPFAAQVLAKLDGRTSDAPCVLIPDPDHSGMFALHTPYFEAICAASRAVGAEGCELHRELNDLWRKYQEPVKAPWPSEEAASDLMRALVTAGLNGEPLAPVVRKALFPAAPEASRGS